MNTEKQMIETLKVEAAKDKALDAVLHSFAIRKRARATITVYALANRMKNEGFTFDKGQYVGILEKLAKAGVGTLVRNAKGRIVALTGISVALQSLGKAVYQGTSISRFNKRNRFAEVQAPKAMRTELKASGVVLT